MQTTLAHPKLTPAYIADAKLRAGIFIESRKIVNALKPGDILYAAHPDRGEFRGFAALHDLFDANMMLPVGEEEAMDQEWMDRMNLIMAKVTELIIEHPLAKALL